ncbi:hypothetical protein Tco_1402472 [Tanacetum coccineum]
MERKQGTAHYNNWQANKQWNKNKVNVENVGGSSKEKAFEEEFPKLPIRNDKKKAVDCIHDKERQKNKFSVLTDVEDDIEEIKIMKDKMIVDQQEDTTKIAVSRFKGLSTRRRKEEQRHEERIRRYDELKNLLISLIQKSSSPVQSSRPITTKVPKKPTECARSYGDFGCLSPNNMTDFEEDEKDFKNTRSAKEDKDEQGKEEKGVVKFFEVGTDEENNSNIVFNDVGGIVYGKARKESLWNKWVNIVKLKGRSVWDIDIDKNDSWFWNNLMSLRDKVRPHFIHRIGNGQEITIWYDTWHERGPLRNIISGSSIYEANLHSQMKVAEIIHNGEWKWPSGWIDKYP